MQPPAPAIQPDLELISEVATLKATVEELKRSHESITAVRGEREGDDGNDGDDEEGSFRPVRKRRKQEVQEHILNVSVAKPKKVLTAEQPRARNELWVCGKLVYALVYA